LRAVVAVASICELSERFAYRAHLIDLYLERRPKSGDRFAPMAAGRSQCDAS
jgi:hypothetical protein